MKISSALSAVAEISWSRKKKKDNIKQCVNDGKEDSSLESNHTKDTMLIASSKTRGTKLAWFVSVIKERDS